MGVYARTMSTNTITAPCTVHEPDDECCGEFDVCPRPNPAWVDTAERTTRWEWLYPGDLVKNPDNDWERVMRVPGTSMRLLRPEWVSGPRQLVEHRRINEQPHVRRRAADIRPGDWLSRTAGWAMVTGTCHGPDGVVLELDTGHVWRGSPNRELLCQPAMSEVGGW